MSHELIYTSVPRGLKPGTKGFCTVAMSAKMPAALVERLESLSGYRPVFPLGDPSADRNPVSYSHWRISVGGRTRSVLSRVAFAGVDYTQRSNKFAHHLVLDPDEQSPGGPAWMMLQPGTMYSAWPHEPQILPSRPLPDADRPATPCATWAAITGDAGWGGVLVDKFLGNADMPIYVVYAPGTEVLPLIEESLALLPPERRWQVTFSSYFTELPIGLSCNWRFVVAGTKAATEAVRTNAAVVDLTTKLAAAPARPAVEAARAGRFVAIEASARATVAPPREVVPATDTSGAWPQQSSGRDVNRDRKRLVEESGAPLVEEYNPASGSGIPPSYSRAAIRRGVPLPAALAVSVACLLCGLALGYILAPRAQRQNITATTGDRLKNDEIPPIQSASVPSSEPAPDLPSPRNDHQWGNSLTASRPSTLTQGPTQSTDQKKSRTASQALPKSVERSVPTNITSPQGDSGGSRKSRITDSLIASNHQRTPPIPDPFILSREQKRQGSIDPLEHYRAKELVGMRSIYLLLPNEESQCGPVIYTKQGNAIVLSLATTSTISGESAKAAKVATILPHGDNEITIEWESTNESTKDEIWRVLTTSIVCVDANKPLRFRFEELHACDTSGSEANLSKLALPAHVLQCLQLRHSPLKTWVATQSAPTTVHYEAPGTGVSFEQQLDVKTMTLRCNNTAAQSLLAEKQKSIESLYGLISTQQPLPGDNPVRVMVREAQEGTGIPHFEDEYIAICKAIENAKKEKNTPKEDEEKSKLKVLANSFCEILDKKIELIKVYRSEAETVEVVIEAKNKLPMVRCVYSSQGTHQ